MANEGALANLVQNLVAIEKAPEASEKGPDQSTTRNICKLVYNCENWSSRT